jgi:hypothetical protein
MYLFRGDDNWKQFDKATIIYILVTIFIAEHGYWIVDRVVKTALERFKTKGEVNVMREDYFLRRKQLRDIELAMHRNSEKSIAKECEIKVSNHSPPGFWKGRCVDDIVYEGKEFLSKGLNRPKIQ